MEKDNMVFLPTDPATEECTPVPNFTHMLISEVKKRPMLWDRKNLHYNSSRSIMNHEWGAIAEILNESKKICRQKWKNLRDQFQKELRKVRFPVKDDTEISYLANYTGKWMHFALLLFLRETMKTKQTCDFCNVRDEIEVDHQTRAFKEEPQKDDEEEDEEDEMPISDYEIKEELIEIKEETILGYDSVASTSRFFEAGESVSPKTSLVQTREEETTDTCLKNGQNQVSGLKRTGLDSISNEEYQESIKCRKLSPAENSDKKDDDLHFFKSLLPFMRRLKPVRKLLVRTEIQTLLLKENLCDIEKDNGNSGDK